MNIDSDKAIKDLIENLMKINSKAFNITRCILLGLLTFYKDGLQFRELKSLLGNISDGKLQSNLDFLLEMEYIKRIKTELDKRNIQVYMIGDPGKVEIRKILNWMEILKNVEGRKNE